MAHWLYIRFPLHYNTIGSLSSYLVGQTTVTGFPIYTKDGEVLLTDENPGHSLELRYGYDDSITGISEEKFAGIRINGSQIVADAYIDVGFSTTDSGYTMISPNKLFRVEEETAIDKHCVVYEDAKISGRYIIREVGTPFMNGCIIPVTYLHNGIVREGIGNYLTGYFTYGEAYYKDAPSASSGAHMDAYSLLPHFRKSDELAPKAITRQAVGSNRLVLDDIKVGDVLDFGHIEQIVPSVLKTWLDNQCDPITDYEDDAMLIEITSPGGVRLLTSETCSNWDIKAIPKLEDKTIAPTKDVQRSTPSDGYAGLRSVQVEAITLQEKSVVPTESVQEVTTDGGYDGLEKVTVGAIPSEYIVPSGSVEIKENGTHDVTEYASVNVDVPQNYEVFVPDEFTVDTNVYAYFKTKIDKPDVYQKQAFVNGLVTLTPYNIEHTHEIVSCEYIEYDIGGGIVFEALYIRCVNQSGQTVHLYYIWEDDVPYAPAVVSQLGIDGTQITKEGWYNVISSGQGGIAEPVDASIILNDSFDQMLPYGDYFYSLFDYKAGPNSESAATLVMHTSSHPPRGISLETKGTRCETDIVALFRNKISVLTYDDPIGNLFPTSSSYEFADVIYLDAELVGGPSQDYCNFNIYSITRSGDYSYNSGFGLNAERRKHNILLSHPGTAGIEVQLSIGTISNIYTNATVVTRESNRAVISGLRHNTHIVVVAEE